MIELPPPNTRRWVARRKAAVVAAVSSGMITLEEACRRYWMSEEEFFAWRRRSRTTAFSACAPLAFRARAKLVAPVSRTRRPAIPVRHCTRTPRQRSKIKPQAAPIRRRCHRLQRAFRLAPFGAMTKRNPESEEEMPAAQRSTGLESSAKRGPSGRLQRVRPLNRYALVLIERVRFIRQGTHRAVPK
jgi:Protein of unknown function (DUF1153)